MVRDIDCSNSVRVCCVFPFLLQCQLLVEWKPPRLSGLAVVFLSMWNEVDVHIGLTGSIYLIIFDSNSIYLPGCSCAASAVIKVAKPS